MPVSLECTLSRSKNSWLDERKLSRQVLRLALSGPRNCLLRSSLLNLYNTTLVPKTRQARKCESRQRREEANADKYLHFTYSIPPSTAWPPFLLFLLPFLDHFSLMLQSQLPNDLVPTENGLKILKYPTANFTNHHDCKQPFQSNCLRYSSTLRFLRPTVLEAPSLCCPICTKQLMG